MSGEIFRGVRGIGPKLEEKLRAKGVDSVEKLALLRPEDVVAFLGVNRAKAHEILKSAKELALVKAVEIQTAQQIYEYRRNVVQRISTGSRAVDELLGGGIETDAVTALAGSFAVGKTQFVHQLIANCVLDLGRDASIIETEPATFQPSRLIQMAKAKGYDDFDLNRVLVVPAKFVTDPYRQRLAYERIYREMEAGRNIGILAIDSFVFPFRAYYHGRETLPERAEEMASHLGLLEEIASKFNVAIVLTTQVGMVPDEGLQIESLKRFGIRERPTGGTLLLHGATLWLSLEQYAANVWRAFVFDAPGLPRRKAFFQLTEAGVRDVPPEVLARLKGGRDEAG